MGCVSSTFLEDDDGCSVVVGTGGLGHHIVSLTSTTYGLLTTLDLPHPKIPPPSSSASSSSSSSSQQSQPPEVINSWELMAGLDPIAPPKPQPPKYSLETFQARCPPGGEDAVVLYTTTLRGIRKTFEDCNAVRSAIEGIGVVIKERDISMDLGFREELRELLKGVTERGCNLPHLFVKGKYIGGAESVLRIHEEGGLVELLEGMPRAMMGGVCDGCGGVKFLPCFRCSGSRKVVVGGVGVKGGGVEMKGKVVRCGECNENGLVLCPICC